MCDQQGTENDGCDELPTQEPPFRQNVEATSRKVKELERNNQD